MRVFGNGGADDLRLTDGPGADTVEGGPTQVRMTQDGVYLNEAYGFGRAEIEATTVATDRASLNGSAGDDFATMGTDGVVFAGAGSAWQIRLTGFTSVSLDAGAGGGHDEVVVRDSVLSDELTYRPETGVLKRGDGIEHMFVGFDDALFLGNSGRRRDRDVVRIFDSPGMESFRAFGSSGSFLDGENRFAFRFKHVERVYLDGSAGGINIRSASAPTYRTYAEGFAKIRSWRFTYRLSRPIALYWIKRKALLLDPELAQIQDREELVIRLRNFVHHRVRQGGNSPKWPYYDAYERFLQAIVSRREGVSCQGAGWLYRDLLNAFGIGAREVGLYSSGPWTHSSVEVRLDDQWVVMDPTFNVSFTDDDGQRLSYSEMRKLGRWTVQYDGMVARHGWVIDTTVPYSRYLYRITYPPVWV